MIYVTPAKLRRSYGTPELLQASGTSDPAHLVDVALLDLKIDGAPIPVLPEDVLAALNAVYDNICQACIDADARVNAAVSARWPVATLPLDPVPPDVERIALWIARYVLRDHVLEEANNTVYRRYREAVEELRALVRGHGTLGIDVPGVVQSGPVVIAPDPVFTGRVLEGMP